MHYAVSIPSQTAQHYSLIGLMYGHQFHQEQESRDMETLRQDTLASHIEDFCDCV